MRDEFLKPMRLRKGSKYVVGGKFSNMVAKRLAFFIERAGLSVRTVCVNTRDALDKSAVTLITPSYSVAQNRSLCQRDVDGVISALAPDLFAYSDAVTGREKLIQMPIMPRGVGDLLKQLGY
jgi:hypothetical protein